MASAQPKQAEESPRASESIEDVFAALESPLLAYAARLAPDLETAEDIVQEAFTRLHAQFQEVQSPRNWLYRTVHNLALNARRGRSKIVPMIPRKDGEPEVELETADSGPLPDEQLAQAEGVALVRGNLKTLDARSRELLHLKFDEDLSYAQIAERTGLSVGNVGYILHHSLKTLAAGLTRSGLIP